MTPRLLLAGVLVLAPDHRPARYDYARCLVARHKYAAAREQLAVLLADEPRNPDYLSLDATAIVGLGDHALAITRYRDLLADASPSPTPTPGAADLHLWLGHALKTVGQLPEAIAAYRTAAAVRPDFGDAYWSLANLKRYRFEDAEIARMRTEEAGADIAAVDRVHLCFALGKAGEDRGDFADAWRYYERGNALARAQHHYRADVFETNTRLQKRGLHARVLRRAHGGGACPTRSDLRGRPAARGLDPDRADPGVAFAGRRHA